MAKLESSAAWLVLEPHDGRQSSPPQEATEGTPIRPGDAWPQDDKFRWLVGRLQVPATVDDRPAVGQPIGLRLQCGDGGEVWIGGKLRSRFDNDHPALVLIQQRAAPGATVRIDVQVYGRVQGGDRFGEARWCLLDPRRALDPVRLRVHYDTEEGEVPHGIVGLSQGGGLADYEDATAAKLREGGFRWFRMDNVLTQVLREEEGTLVYDWSDLDRRVEFIAGAMRADPILAVSYMPIPLDAVTNHDRQSAPRDYGLWEDLCYRAARRCLQRGYRIPFWEVWNEVNTGWLKPGPQDTGAERFRALYREARGRDDMDEEAVRRFEAYCKLYRATAKGVRRVDPTAKIGGPALASGPFEHEERGHCFHGKGFAKGLILFCKEEGLPLDFVSWHEYFQPVDVFVQEVGAFRDYLRAAPQVEAGVTSFMVTEWNQAWWADRPHDHEIGAAWCANTITRAFIPHRIDRPCFFYVKQNDTNFRGDFSMLMRDNVPKASFNVLKIFNGLRGRWLRVSGTDDDISAVAAWDKQRGRLAVVVVNFRDRYGLRRNVELRLDPLPARLAGGTWREWIVDATHANVWHDARHAELEPITGGTIEDRVLTVRRTIPANAITLIEVLAPPGAAGEPSHSQEDPFVKERRALRHRRRRIILNNDGCDALYFPADLEPTPENFLAQRTSPLAGSQVDTVFYCTISSGFSNFTHRTKAGHILTRQVGEELAVAGKTNITQTLVDQGTDPLKLVQDWCHDNGRECFWSFRMNDTHDGAQRPDKEYPLFPQLKKDHPEYMIGTYRKRPKHGAWTAVNYALPEIRELAFRYVEEVCKNYDVDGVELDFCRHLSYFPPVAFGGEATDDERAMMTGLLRRIRAMAEHEGRRRGRPILIATRVPDSMEYCRAVGLDLKQWLEDDLIDILTGGFYLRLNPWEYLVKLGHAHDVAVYAGLSESRVRGDAEPFGRNSPESYRGRAMRVWQAGADGIYLFNYFDPDGAMLREIGDPEKLRPLDSIYYASVRNRNPDAYLAGGRRFQTIPILTPQNPARITTGEPYRITIALGDESPKPNEPVPDVKLHLQIAGAGDLRVDLNGTQLPEPAISDAWTVFPIEPKLLKPGGNEVAITANPPETPKRSNGGWNVVYTAREKPAAPWTGTRPRDTLLAEIKDGVLLIADRGAKPGDYFYYAYPWNIDPAAETVVEARVKVVSGWNNIIVANGAAYERIALYPDRVALYEAKRRHAMDTTDTFHTYRIVMRGRDLTVFVDGKAAIDGTGTFTKALPGRNDIRFGAANSPSLGEAYWESVKLRFQSASIMLYDMVLSVQQGDRR